MYPLKAKLHIKNYTTFSSSLIRKEVQGKIIQVGQSICKFPLIIFGSSYLKYYRLSQTIYEYIDDLYRDQVKMCYEIHRHLEPKSELAPNSLNLFFLRFIFHFNLGLKYFSFFIFSILFTLKN
jgi:hypothetical protein